MSVLYLYLLILILRLILILTLNLKNFFLNFTRLSGGVMPIDILPLPPMLDLNNVVDCVVVIKMHTNFIYCITYSFIVLQMRVITQVQYI